MSAQKRGKTHRRATIIDVARLSGVSKSTVANVINGKGPLSDQTRARVEKAIDQLGYRPNALARDLKRQRTMTVGVLVGDLANPFYAELTKLIEGCCAEAGYATIICHTDGDPSTERDRIEVLLQQRVSGVLMLYFSGNETGLEDLARNGIPTVGVSVFDKAFDCVASDDAAGARLAVEHLASLGHRRIAYVLGTGTETSTNRTRLRGCRQALKAIDAAAMPVVSLTTPPARSKAVTVDAALQAEHRPSAFVVGNDLTALELVDELEERGGSVPSDFSVVGFDDIPPAHLGRLSLTTVRQPIAKLATLGVGRLLVHIDPVAAIDGGKPQQRLPIELVVRGTTAPPR